MNATAIADDARPTVTIVLCTWRSGPALEQQLASCLAQDWPCILRVHDDGSGDDTVARVRALAPGAVVYAHDDNLGFVGNFERGIQDALDHDARYIALADQDDLWHPDRISRGMRRLLAIESHCGATHPVLVHADLRVIDAAGRLRHESYLRWRGYRRPVDPHLPTALGQCGVMGNTSLFNRALATEALPFPEALFVHDWWLGLVAELYGSRHLLQQPVVDYRLHDSNASNPMNALGKRRMHALQRLLGGSLLCRDFRLPWCEDNRRETLQQLLLSDTGRRRLRPEQRRTIADFVDYLSGKGSRWSRLGILLRHGFLKPALTHRIRVALVLLSTQRYGPSGATAAACSRAGSSKPSKPVT